MRYLTIPSRLRPKLGPADSSHGLAALSLAQFLVALAIMASTPLLPLFVAELDARSLVDALRWTGLALAISPLVAAVATPIWGVLADRFGYKLAVQRALVGVAAALGLMGLSQSPIQIVALRAFSGAVGGFTAAAQAAALAQTGREGSRQVVARLQSVQMFGAVLGPAIGGVAAGWIGIRPTLLACGLIVGLALAVVHLLVPDAPRRAESAAEAAPARAMAARPGSRSRSGRGVPLVLLLAAVFVVQVGEQSLLPALPGYLTGLGGSVERLPLLVGLTLSLGSLAMAVSVRLLPRLAPRTGAGALLPVLLLGAGLFASTLALVPVWWAVLPVRALAGLMVGAALGLAYMLAAERTEPGQVGRTMGLLSSAAFLGAAVGPLLGSALAARHVGWLFLMVAVLYGVVAGTIAFATPAARRLERWAVGNRRGG